MRRSTLFVVVAMLAMLLSSCGRGGDAPSVSNEHPFVGEKFTISGTIDADGARPITLEAFDEQWDEVAEAKTNADGGYRFTTSQKESTSRYRVVAPAAGELDRLVTAPVKVATVEDAVTLSVVRAGRSGTALGESKFRKPGRTFELQRLDGTTWKTIDTAHEDQHGRTKIPFDVEGTRFYRLVGDVIKGTQGATSPTEKFSKGPKKLSPNVIYVTVEGGKNPIIKGEDYKANAVLVTDGEPSKPLRVDEFEVRGNSSAAKVKHPYKMKFKKSRRPFNLPDDKTWILLANYGDRSLVRTALGYDIGAGLNGLDWTPRSAFTELFINGEYVGSYQISESVKIDKNRINIDKEKGVVVEVDKHFREDHVPGFYGDHEIPYAFKDPDERKKGKNAEEGITDAKVDGIKSRIRDFEKVLYGDDFKDPRTAGRSTSTSTRRSTTTWSRSSPRRTTATSIAATSSTPTTTPRRTRRSSWDRCGTSTAAPGRSRTRRSPAPPSRARPVGGSAATAPEPQHRQDPLVRADDPGPGVPRCAQAEVGGEARETSRTSPTTAWSAKRTKLESPPTTTAPAGARTPHSGCRPVPRRMRARSRTSRTGTSSASPGWTVSSNERLEY